MAPTIPVEVSPGNPKLLDKVCDVIRRKHYSFRTEQTYVDWIRRFILFHGKRHPSEMAEAEVTEFLTYLARKRNVAASTQNQALSALLFLYKEVLKHEIGWLDQVERVKRPATDLGYRRYCVNPTLLLPAKGISLATRCHCPAAPFRALSRASSSRNRSLVAS